MKNDALSKAVAYLGAVEVAPNKYALTWGKRWYVTDAEGVELTRLLGGGEMIASIPTKMPAWWTPEQRFAWRDAKGFMYFHAERAKAYNATERITADLVSGAEVPA
jgi:hypothetical protein